MNKNGILKRLSRYFAALIALTILVYISAIPLPVSAAYYNDTFNLDKAQKYAEKWAYGRNTDEYFSHGDYDCANFVSQILIAGGIPETSYFHASKSYSSSQAEQTYSTKNVPSLIQYFRSMYGVAYYNKKSALSVGSISAETYMAGSNDYDGVTKNACDGHSFGINDIEPGDCVTITGTYGRSHIVYVLSVDKNSNAVHYAAHTRDAYNETYNLNLYLLT